MFDKNRLTSVITGLPASERRGWIGLLLEQQGLITKQQATNFGLTKSTIQNHLNASRWRRVLHGVYAVFTGPLPKRTQLMAALLYAGQPAVLSHRTAAQEWGMLTVDEAGPIHVTVPYNCSAVSHQPEVIVHRSRAFHHIATVDGAFPRTSRADTIIDVAAAESSTVHARRRFIQLGGSAQVSLIALQQQLELRPPPRFRSTLHEALQLIQGGALSALEAEYVLLVESAHGLPLPRRQTPVSVNGRTLWEDITYDNLGVPLTIRLDGREWHSTPGVVFRDRERDNAAELAGRQRLTYGWQDITEKPCAVATEVLTILRRSGWKGKPKKCLVPFCQLKPRE